MNGEHPYEKISTINFDEPPRPRLNRFVLIGAVLVARVLLRILFPFVEPLCLDLPILAALTWVASFGLDEALDEIIRFLRRLRKLV